MNDARLIAADAVLEYASILNGETAALIAAAASGDIAQIEARLWTCRRALTGAIKCWREADQVEALRQAAE